MENVGDLCDGRMVDDVVGFIVEDMTEVAMMKIGPRKAVAGESKRLCSDPCFYRVAG